MKTALARVFPIPAIGGFRSSRGTDVTPPSLPVLTAPVPQVNALATQWVSGNDPESGIRETWAEVSPQGAGIWARTVVDYDQGRGTSTVFLGLGAALPFDVRIQTINNAGLQSGYTAVQTATTLGSSPALEPGTIAFVANAASVGESQNFSIGVSRVGAGASSPSVQADWSISDPTGQVACVPGNGTLTWGPAENDIQLIQANAGSVLLTTTATLSIVAVRALSGTLQPTLATPSIPLTVVINNTVGKKFNPGHYMASNNLTFPDDRHLTDQRSEQDLVLSSGINVLGWKGYYYPAAIWNDVSNALDATKILRDLNRLQQFSTKKRLAITIIPQLFNSLKFADMLPASVYNNATYGAAVVNGVTVAGKFGYCSMNGGKSLTIAWWRPAVMDWIIAMFRQIAAILNPVTGLVIDQDPYVEQISFGETSMGVDPGTDFGNGAAVVTQYKRLIDALYIAFGNTVHMCNNNYTATQSQAQDLDNYFAPHAVAEGGPDIQPPTSSSSNGLSWGQRGILGGAQPSPIDGNFLGPDLRGVVAMMADIQAPELVGGGNNAAYTPFTLYQVADQTLHQSHIFWTCVSASANNPPVPAYPGTGKNTGLNPGNWPSVMQVINANPVTHRTKPTSIP